MLRRSHIVTLAQLATAILIAWQMAGGGVGKGGTATLTVDGNEVAKGKIPRTILTRVSLDETLDIGEDCGTRSSTSSKVPFKFTGKIEMVTIELK